MIKRTATVIAIASLGLSAQAQLIGLSIPVNSMDSNCRPRDEGVWSVSGSPPSNTSGIGWWVNPNLPTVGDFVLHDHVYSAPHVPDPSRSVVTYVFGTVTRVTQLSIMEHGNGISAVEAFAGNDPSSMTSLGTIFGSKGDAAGFAELEMNTFEIPEYFGASHFRFVVRKTSLADGYAAYRGILTTTNPVPEPGTLAALGLGGLALLRRRKRA